MKDNLEIIFEKYKDNIFAIGFNYFKNALDADDIVQEVFYKYYKSEKNFESEEHIRNWLVRVAVNECKRVTMSSWFRTKESLEDYSDKLIFTDPQEGELFQAVMKLSKKYRQVVHLYYYEDYSTKEIADILKISQTAVTTRLERARAKLKIDLMEAWKDEQ